MQRVTSTQRLAESSVLDAHSSDVCSHIYVLDELNAILFAAN